MNRSQCASSRRWICSSCSTYYTNGKSYSFPEPHTRTHMLEMMTKDYFSSSSSPLTAAYSLLQLNIIILHDLQENWYCLKHLIFELHIKVDGIVSCLKLKLAPSFFNLLAVHRTYIWGLNISKKCLILGRTKSFTSLNSDLQQDISIVYSFSKYLIWKK